MKQTTAIILAAGIGKRIKPITTPKPLIPFLGKPLISWIINDLQSTGIRNFVIVASPQVKSAFNTDLPVAIQSKPKGMADALIKAKKLIKTDSIIVLNSSDLLSPSAYQHFLSAINRSQSEIMLTGLKLDHYLEGGYFKLKDGQPIAVIEKPGEGNQPSPYFNIVLHYFRNASKFLSLLAATKSKQDDVYEKALSKLMASKKIDLFEYSDYFVQIKYHHQILDMTDLLLNHRLKEKSFIHPSAKVLEGAVIKNSYIGQNVIIGNNCLIRDSIIEKGSVVGYNTEIARSYIGPKNFFHCNYVGDSVVESSSNLGSGARIANLRFDKKPIANTSKTKLGVIMAKASQLGINASVMPGVTIGQNSLIGPGVVLSKSVKSNQKVFS